MTAKTTKRNPVICLIIAVAIYFVSIMCFYGVYFDEQGPVINGYIDLIKIIPFGIRHLFQAIGPGEGIVDKIAEVLIHASGLLGIIIAETGTSYRKAVKSTVTMNVVPHVIAICIGLVEVMFKIDFVSVFFLLAAIFVMTGTTGGSFILLIFEDR